MRTKIGKRIGPVPIALVAVLALAAFISAGFWLVPDGGQTAEAQGLPTTPEAGGGTDECAVLIHGEAGDNPAPFPEGIVSDEGCTGSGDSVDVMFENSHEEQDKSIAVYVTGGEQFSSLQATDANGKALGASGVDEYLLTVGPEEDGFSGPEAGSQTITVDRDMAKNGVVYLFAYLAATDTKGFAENDIPLSNLVNDKTRTRMEEDELLTPVGAGGSIVTIANALRADAIAYAFDNDEDPTTAGISVLAETDVDDLDGAMVSPQLDAEGDPIPNALRADVDNEQETLDMAQAVIDAVTGMTGYEAFKVVNADNAIRDIDSGVTSNEDAVQALVNRIRETQAAVDAIDGGDPDNMPNSLAPLAVKVVFTNAAAEAKLKRDGTYGGPNAPGEDETYTLGSTLFTGRGTLSSNENLSDGATTADVEVSIRDALGVALSGFVNFSVDTTAAGAADAVFKTSTLSTHRLKLGDDGKVKVEVTGLEKNVALRIPVTVSYGGDFQIVSNIVRDGDAMMVEAKAYACEADKDDGEDAGADDVCVSEIKVLGNSNTSDDPDEVVALGPNQSFVIAGKATDSVGNNVGEGDELSWKITADADNADDAEETLDDDSGKTLEIISVKGDDDAVPGVYSLTVTSPDGEASTMIMITVSDEASMIMLSCDPEIVPVRTGETLCTATVTDDNGNIPSNLVSMGTPDERHKVTITVRDKEAQHPDDANFNAMGMARFLVLLSEDVEIGREITVNVTASIDDEILRQSTVLTYGEIAAPMPEPMPMTTELTAPSDVVVSSLANTQSISVTWDTTSIENAQQVKVVLFNSDVTGLAQVDGALITISAANDMGSHTFSDVPAGMYNVVVASFRTGEPHQLSDIKPVTVE